MALTRCCNGDGGGGNADGNGVRGVGSNGVDGGDFFLTSWWGG